MMPPRSALPFALVLPAYVTGLAIGTRIGTAWNAGADIPTPGRAAARVLHRPPRDVRARMALVPSGAATRG